MRFGWIAALVFLAGGSATAEGEVSTLADQAAKALGEAAEALAAAEDSPDRIAALTSTIQAYEAGLSAMREGLRQAVLREREVEARLVAQDAELGELLALLQNVSRAGQARTVLHPEGAVQTVRSGILASALVPALEERSDSLETDLIDLEAIRTVQEAGIATLAQGLQQIREARFLLTKAISERSDLPATVATDEAAMEALINSSETLAAFADSLVSDGETDSDPEGQWSLPVAGEVIRSFGETDAAGVRRSGWLVGTAPEALVTAPTDATVRFSGEIPESGQVIILEASPGRLVILTGHAQSFVLRGQIVSQGDPVGLMGGSVPAIQEKLIETSILGGQPREETLYIEIRQGQAPVDPAAFLRPSKE